MESALAGPGDGEEAFLRLLRCAQTPTAVVVATSRWALVVLDCCKRRGVAVPDEIAVCGIDNIGEAALADPALTTVDVSLRRQGEEAVRSLLEQINSQPDTPRHVIVPPQLIIREST